MPNSPHVLAGDRVLRDRIIVSIGPVVYAVDYAVRLTELKGVPRDASGRVIAMGKAAKSPSEEPNPICVSPFEQLLALAALAMAMQSLVHPFLTLLSGLCGFCGVSTIRISRSLPASVSNRVWFRDDTQLGTTLWDPERSTVRTGLGIVSAA